MFGEQSFRRTDVVHAFSAGSRGPRAGRGSRLAGPETGKPQKQQAWLDWLCEQDDDPSDQPEGVLGSRIRRAAAWQDELTGEELAEAREAAADEMLALDAASAGRRGPGRRRLGPGVPGRVGVTGRPVSARGWRGT